jgi:hypothetical protein
MGPVVTPDQAAPRPNSFPLDSAVDALIAQARAEERAIWQAEVTMLREHIEKMEDLMRSDRDGWPLAVWNAQQELRAERARVLAVIAEVRDTKVPDDPDGNYGYGWVDACDAITQALEGDE